MPDPLPDPCLEVGANPLAALLLGVARSDPGRPLLRGSRGERWTHGDLDAASARLAHLLTGIGVRPGDRVAVQTEKSADVIALHVACARAGAVYLPLNPAYTDREVRGLLTDAEPALLVRDDPIDVDCPRVTLPALVEQAARRPATYDDVARALQDPAALLYTSGTTGRPKGAVLSHGNLTFSAETLTQVWGFTGDDVLLHVLPLFHTHGLFVAVHCVLVSGASMVLHDGFDPAAVCSELPATTVLMGVPTHYARLLAHPGFDAAAAASVRLFTSGSAPMLVSTHEQFAQRTGKAILERYGMTETCMLTSNPLVGDRRAGTVGVALPGVKVRVSGGEPGRIEVFGPNVFAGYWRRPELRATEFTADGWFITGDLGRRDAAGYLEIVGRSKDVVISGGLNIYPKEVELVLDGLPGVLESAVVGLPDPDLGEVVVGAVVARGGAVVDGEHLRSLARADLAAFKVPKRIHLVAELPRNAMGKVEKARLRHQLDPPR